MIASEVKLPHVGWNVEFSTNGKMGHITNKNWQGVKGVAGTHSGFPKHSNIILLHDKHWRGKSELLKALINTLKTRCTFLPLGSLPRGLNTIKYVP